MLKTEHFNLNKPEAADPMRVEDFNENSDIIDAALKQVDDNSVTRSAQVRSEAANALAAYKTSNDAAVAAVNTAVSTKAEQNAVDALTTAVAGMVVPKLAVGSYKGSGVTGSTNKNTLTFDFEPKIVGIVVDAMAISNNGALFVRGQSKSSGIGEDTLDLTVTWTGNSVSWYGDSSGAPSDQLNGSAYTYYYFAIG